MHCRGAHIEVNTILCYGRIHGVKKFPLRYKRFIACPNNCNLKKHRTFRVGQEYSSFEIE